MLFGKDKKEQQVLQQDLNETIRPGAVFMIQLLMKEQCGIPKKDAMTSIMEKHLGEVDCFCHDERMAGFAVKKYTAEFKDASVPPQLMITGCTEFPADKISELERSQMWDCREDRDRILTECKYQVLAVDMLAATLLPHDRADMLMDYLEALVEMYPECEAVYFGNSGKLFLAEQIRNHQIPRKDRFIYFAVNVRFFNIQGGQDMMVDTLGMNTLFLPDLQYHFHGMDPNWVVNHAYNMASYIFDHENPIENGNTIDGIVEGRINASVQWKCHYENALIQPVREVIDICMNEYAAGNRDYD